MVPADAASRRFGDHSARTWQGDGPRRRVVKLLVRGRGHVEVVVRQGGRRGVGLRVHGRVDQPRDRAGLVILGLLGWRFLARPAWGRRGDRSSPPRPSLAASCSADGVTSARAKGGVERRGAGHAHCHGARRRRRRRRRPLLDGLVRRRDASACGTRRWSSGSSPSASSWPASSAWSSPRTHGRCSSSAATAPGRRSRTRCSRPLVAVVQLRVLGRQRPARRRAVDGGMGFAGTIAFPLRRRARAAAALRLRPLLRGPASPLRGSRSLYA